MSNTNKYRFMKKNLLLSITLVLSSTFAFAQNGDLYKNGKSMYAKISKEQIKSLDAFGVEMGLATLHSKGKGDTLLFELKRIKDDFVSIKGIIFLLKKSTFSYESFLKAMLDGKKKMPNEFDTWVWTEYKLFGKHSGTLVREMSGKDNVYSVTEYSPDGKIYKSTLNKGLLDGKYQIFDSDNKIIYESNFDNGVPK